MTDYTIVLVTGGRHYTDMGAVFDCITHLNENFPNLVVVHGDARGADSLAYEVCREVGIDQVRCPATWKKYERAAGPIRNRLMLDLLEVDMILAFPGGVGTADMKDTARIQEIPVIESEELLGEIRGGESQK